MYWPDSLLFSDSSVKQPPAQHMEKSCPEPYKLRELYRSEGAGTGKLHQAFADWLNLGNLKGSLAVGLGNLCWTGQHS